jgi:hypothetical protein
MNISPLPLVSMRPADYKENKDVVQNAIDLIIKAK